jgi:hypothetical protein
MQPCSALECHPLTLPALPLCAQPTASPSALPPLARRAADPLAPGRPDSEGERVEVAAEVDTPSSAAGKRKGLVRA